eukprot:scaffold406182_cov41-Prasinocladus_malaysianus.AAC.1
MRAFAMGSRSSSPPRYSYALHALNVHSLVISSAFRVGSNCWRVVRFQQMLHSPGHSRAFAFLGIHLRLLFNENPAFTMTISAFMILLVVCTIDISGTDSNIS